MHEAHAAALPPADAAAHAAPVGNGGVARVLWEITAVTIHADRAAAIARCSFLPGSWDKRFAREMGQIAAAGGTFTERQAANIDRLAHKYRRQMPERLVP